MNTSTPSQLHLIYKLESMRQIILNTTDRKALFSLAKKVCDITFPVPIDPAFKYKIEGKERTLLILSNEIRTYQKSNTELEIIKFQLSSTILILMLQFIDGSLKDLQQIIVNLRKVA